MGRRCWRLGSSILRRPPKCSSLLQYLYTTYGLVNDTISEHFDYQRRVRGMSNFDLTRSQGLLRIWGQDKKEGCGVLFSQEYSVAAVPGLSPVHFVQNVHLSLYYRTWYRCCVESASHMVWEVFVCSDR